MSPILLDFPLPLVTKRLYLRPLQAGDGPSIFQAVEESRDILEKWLPWPVHVKNWQDSEIFARQSYADFILRKSFTLGIFKDNTLIGVCGFNSFIWDIPAAEIGYWCRLSAQKQGFMTEAVHYLTFFGFEKIGLQRLSITCLEENKASAAVAEKNGYHLETKAYGLLPSLQGSSLEFARRYVKLKEPFGTVLPT